MDFGQHDLDSRSLQFERIFWPAVFSSVAFFIAAIVLAFTFGWQPFYIGLLVLNPVALYCTLKGRRDMSLSWTVAGALTCLGAFVVGYVIQLVLVGKQ